MCLVNDDECSPSKRCLPDQNLPTRIPIDPTTGFSPIHSPSYSNAQTVSYASTSVTSYGSSTLAGANTYSPPIHYAQAPPPPPPPPQAQDKLTPEPSPGSKRRQAEEYSSNKRRRGVNGAPAAVVDEGDDGDDGEDAHVGPNGGPKHWTAAEKSKLFNWMLGQDDQWESLKAKMNTVFRDVSIFHHGTNAFISSDGLHGLILFLLVQGSVQLFNGRKSFTALKSCFHRNLEVFKQIHAFENYLSSATTADPDDPDSGPPPAQFHSTLERQTYLERKLETARAARVPIGNLNLKTIDHWHEMGWYALFKARYV